ncbi:hypothetical protein ADK38_05435, partial [Streptomyces varsoviensis]
ALGGVVHSDVRTPVRRRGRHVWAIGGYPSAMHSEIFYLAADNGLRGGIAPLAVGIVVVALLIGAVAYGRRRRER